MNGSAWIGERKWVNRKGERQTRYDVFYRRGGRGHKKVYAGAFASRKNAKDRVHLIMGCLARGVDPRGELSRDDGREDPTVEMRWDAWTDSLRDVGERRKEAIASAFKYIQPILGHMAPASIQVEDGLRLLAHMERSGLAAGSISLYFNVARQFMDSQVPTNVLRSKLIRLPLVVQDEINAMGFDEYMAMRAAMARTERKSARGQAPTAGPALLLAMDFMEATALRLGDARKLLRGDLDMYEGRVRVSRARGKSSRSRWVPVPSPLLDEIAARDLANEQALFPELTRHDLHGAMMRACAEAGIRHFHPHDLRHRRASLWIYQGVPLPVLKERVGHSDLGTTLRVYAHVVPDSRDRWSADDYLGGAK